MNLKCFSIAFKHLKYFNILENEVDLKYFNTKVNEGKCLNDNDIDHLFNIHETALLDKQKLSALKLLSSLKNDEKKMVLYNNNNNLGGKQRCTDLLSDDLFEFLVQHLGDVHQFPCTRFAALQLLVALPDYGERMSVDELKKISLEIAYSNSYDHLLLCLSAFQFTVKLMTTEYADSGFLLEYYNSMKKCTILPGICLVPLDNFMVNGDEVDKLRLMSTLVYLVLSDKSIDCRVFFDEEPNNWCRELLCRILISGIPGPRSRIELKVLIEKLNQLYEFIDKEENCKYAIEDILKCLIERKRNGWPLLNDMTAFTGVVILLKSSVGSLCAITNMQEAEVYKILITNWTRVKLSNKCVKYTDSDIANLINCIDRFGYCTVLLDMLFDNISCNACFADVYDFFKFIQLNVSDADERNSIIAKLVRKGVDESGWKNDLCQSIVGSVISREFPDYVFTEQREIAYNAFNQRNDISYWYTSDDIAVLWDEIGSSFKCRLRLTQAVPHSPESHMQEIAAYFNRDGLTTLVPLNIDDKHWVSLALVQRGESKFVLYKDSLGVDSFRDEKKHVLETLKSSLGACSIVENGSVDQTDLSSCGAFMLNNLKIMATELNSDGDFIEKFPRYKFTSQSEINNLRSFELPKLYAGNVYRPIKRNQINEHHYEELKSLKNFILENNPDLDVRINETSPNGITLSVDIPSDEPLNSTDYSYHYCVKFQDESSRIRIINCFNVPHSSDDGNILKFSHSLITFIEKKETFDFSTMKLQLTYENFNNLLELLEIQPTPENKAFLKANLNIDYPSAGNVNNTRVLSNTLLSNLHRKLTRIAMNEWSRKSVINLVAILKSPCDIESFLSCLDIIYEYHLEESECDPNGNSILDIFNSSFGWKSQMFNIALRKHFNESRVKSVSQLTHELINLNQGSSVNILNENSLNDVYSSVMRAYNGGSRIIADNHKSEFLNNWRNQLCKLKKKLQPDFDEIDFRRVKRSLNAITKCVESNLKFVENFHVLTECTVCSKQVDDINVGDGRYDIGEELQIMLNESSKNYLCNVNTELISKWNEQQIGSWLKLIGSSGTDLLEMIAVVMRSVELTRKYRVREVQLMSLIITLFHGTDGGVLEQVSTGEGKTTIIAMLAALKGLMGYRVDIITSSSELAKPQSEEFKDFYSLLNLTVSNNCEGPSIKERYMKDIVYGSATDFQGDILRDEYCLLGTRSGRKCMLAIVDEVDSMLLDGKNAIVRLTSPKPGMSHLVPILAQIWLQVLNAASTIVERNGQAFYIYEEIQGDETDPSKSSVKKTEILLSMTKKEFVAKATESHLRKVLRDLDKLEENERSLPEGFPIIEYPKHLKEFVSHQLPYWIENAIIAKFVYKNGYHYIISQNKIIPIDVSNTGILQLNTKWGDALHAFLEIKHGLKVTPENLSTNYISNASFFQRYGKNIYGFTGTLGSLSVRRLLLKVYNVTSVIIPPYKNKQHKELAPIFTFNQEEWYSEIVSTSMDKLKLGRSCLIITKYIENVKMIAEKFINDFGYDRSKIRIYATDNDSETVRRELAAGEVIIATNLAGRGTDIKLSQEVNSCGGLHVLITNLPKTQRVEHQNVGRTSRTGLKGTSQFILLSEKSADMNKMRERRDEKENESLALAESVIAGVLVKDQIFAEFCCLLCDIDVINDISCKSAVEERFAIWLKLQRFDLTSSKALEKFEEFKKEILDDEKRHQLIKNPYFFVLRGNEMLERSSYRSAIEEYSKAIDLDGDFMENAYYNRAYAKLCSIANGVENNVDTLKSAIDDFKYARRIIRNHMDYLNLIQIASQSEVLSEQVRHKMILFQIQLNVIDHNIGIDVDRARNDIKSYEKEMEKENQDEGVVSKCRENVKILEKDILERGNGGFLGQIVKSKNNLKVNLVGMKKSLPEDEDFDLYAEEISEFRMNGYVGGISISEIPPIPWKSVLTMALIGLAQIVIGSAIMVFASAGGSSIGIGLIIEGVSDIITAVKDGIIDRHIDWKSWGLQKAISLSVMLVCVGYSAIKDAAFASTAAVESIAALTKTGTLRFGWKLAGKFILNSGIKQMASKALSCISEYLLDKTFIPKLESFILDKVKPYMEKALKMISSIREILLADSRNRNYYYQTKLKNMILEKLTSTTNQFFLFLNGFVKGTKQKLTGLSSFFSAIKCSFVIHELCKFGIAIKEHIEKAINQIVSEKNENDQKKAEQLKKRERVSENPDVCESGSNIAEDSDDEENVDIDLNNADVMEDQCEFETRDAEFSSKFVDDLTHQLLVVIKSKLIMPAVDKYINAGVNSLSSNWDQSLMNELNYHQSRTRLGIILDNNKSGRLPDDYASNAKNDSKANEIISNLINDGEGGLHVMGALSDITNCPIKVLDKDGKVIDIIGGDKSGKAIEVEYHESDTKDSSGHYTLPGSRDAPGPKNLKRNCLFNVVAFQSGMDPKQLRVDTIDYMITNKDKTTQIAFETSKIESYCSDALLMGGKSGSSRKLKAMKNCEKPRKVIKKEKKRLKSDEVKRRRIMHRPLTEYPGGEIEIEIGGEKETRIAHALLNKLSDDYNQARNTQKKNRLRVSKTKGTEHHCNVNIFGPFEEGKYQAKDAISKYDMMIGVGTFKYSNGKVLKITSVSGPNAFCNRADVTVDTGKNESCNLNPKPFKSNIEGYEYIHNNPIDQPIIDMSTGKTAGTYNRACAAQKLSYHANLVLSEMKKSDPSVRLTKASLFETQYNPSKKYTSSKLLVGEGSCKSCEGALPFAFGAKKK